MAAKSKARGGRVGKAPAGEGWSSGDFAAYLLARAPAEDIEGYEPAMLARAAALAQKAVDAHRKGDSIVAVETDPGLQRQGMPVSAITVVSPRQRRS